MTREEAIICKVYLNDLDKYRTCNEYKLLMQLLEQEPCKDCCNGNQIEKAKLCQKSYLAGMEHKQEPRWIPCSERLPKENEYIGNVCKYYLIQDEYLDMHVAHLSNVGWIPIDSLKAIGAEIIAWRELPLPYRAESEE